MVAWTIFALIVGSKLREFKTEISVEKNRSLGESKVEEVDGKEYNVGKFDLPLGLINKLSIWAAIGFEKGEESFRFLETGAVDGEVVALEYVRRIGCLIVVVIGEEL